MYAILLTAIEVLLVLMLLFPEEYQDLVMFRIPPVSRPDPNRIGMRSTPAVAIFVWAILMFQSWAHVLHSGRVRMTDPIQLRLGEIAAVLLLGVGMFGCIWPLAFMERFVPALRGKTANLDPSYSRKVALAGKFFGVISLLFSAHLFRQSFQ